MYSALHLFYVDAFLVSRYKAEFQKLVEPLNDGIVENGK